MAELNIGGAILTVCDGWLLVPAYENFTATHCNEAESALRGFKGHCSCAADLIL